MDDADKTAVETFNQINYFCIAIFTIEIVLRLISTPKVPSENNLFQIQFQIQIFTDYPSCLPFRHSIFVLAPKILHRPVKRDRLISGAAVLCRTGDSSGLW